MMKDSKRSDKLCLLPYSKLESARPYSNISEYCLRDGRAVSEYLSAHGVKTAPENMSDYELLAAVVDQINRDPHSFVATRIREALNKLCNTDTSKMSAEEIWVISSSLLDEKNADDLFDLDLDAVGVPMLLGDESEFPSRVGDTAIDRVLCPFGIEGFDISHFADRGARDRLMEGISRSSAVGVFCGGFEFDEPNEYAAERAEEKLLRGQKLGDKEKRILSSQLFRELMIKCAEEDKELMVFLPSAPDVWSMGEFARLLSYIDRVIRSGELRATVFAPDPVGLCFARSLTAVQYKKITAETGICGNGCGCADIGDAAYWGVEALDVKKASLSSTPAFIGK